MSSKKGSAPLTSAKMKRHDSIRRFVVADAYESGRGVPGNSLINEYHSGKYKPPKEEESQPLKQRRKIKRRITVSKKQHEVNADAWLKSIAHSVSTEALDMGMNQACDRIYKEPTTFLAHSMSHKALHEGMNISLNQIVDNPPLLLAHATTHEILNLALHHLGKSEESRTEAVPALDYHSSDEFHDEHLLQLLQQAQSILSKHQAARRKAMSPQQKMMLSKKKLNEMRLHTKSFFRKSSSIDLIESTKKFDKINASYDALHMPPFANSAGPNLDRYKSSCRGDYEGKKLVDKLGTGIGVTIESLHQTAKDRQSKKADGATPGDARARETRAWPSSAIQEAADSWVDKQRRHVDEARNQKHGVGHKSAGGSVDRAIEEQAQELYTRAFEALLARLDMVVAIAHCGECRNHVTLRHHEEKYQLLAYDLLSRLIFKCLTWRVPFRVGALTLPRRASLGVRTKQAYNRIKEGLNGEGNTTSEAELVPLLLQKCCACVPVGSFEVIMACRDEVGAFHYVRLFSKLETQKFPHPGALIKRLASAIELVIGVSPERLLAAFGDETQKGGNEPQLTVPSCAYPEVCLRGCQTNKVDSYTLEDLRSPDEIADLIGVKLKAFEPSELELGLGATSTSEEMVWVADFSLESKHHLFSVGDVVDVRQAAPLHLSPRRKRKRHTDREKVGDEQSRSIDHYNLAGLYVQYAPTVRNALHPLPSSLARPVSPLAELPTISMTLVEIMESRTQPLTIGASRPYSPNQRDKEVGTAQVYSPVRTAAYLRNSGTAGGMGTTSVRPRSPIAAFKLARRDGSDSLFERGLETRVPFSKEAPSSAAALVPPLKSPSDTIADHQLPFKVSKVVERDATGDGRVRTEAEEGREEAGSSQQLWYSQGFLRGVIRSAHRDGTYDIEYLPQDINRWRNADEDDKDGDQNAYGNIYIADSFPAYAGRKSQPVGFVDIGVQQAFVTTVRGRDTLQNEAEIAFALQHMRQSSVDDGVHSQRFVFTHSDESLEREKRPWRREAASSEAQARLQYIGGDDTEVVDSVNVDDDDDSFGDVDDFLRGAMLGVGGGSVDPPGAEDQREDPFTPCELQAYAPIAHLS